MRGFCVVLMLAALLPATVRALTIGEIDVGEHIRGPNYGAKDFTGKVVLIDLWGVNCVPCIAQMPALQELYKKYKYAGFHIVALERQADTNVKAYEFFANNPLFKGPALEFQFTYSGRTPIPGRYIPLLPSNFLFNADGYLIGSNLHGEELENRIQEALVEAFAGITNPGDIGRLADYEARLKSGQDMMPALSDIIRKKKTSADSRTIDEATKLFTAVFDWANKKYDRALAMKERNPVAALMSLKTIVRLLNGTDVAERAGRAVDELSQDIRVIKEEKADKALRDIVTQISDMKPTHSGSRDPNDAEYRKINAAAFKTLANDCRQLQTVFTDTAAAKHAQEIIDDYRLKEIN